MEKIERDYNGWDITITGKRFSDRFQVKCTPNMNYVYQTIKNELYKHLATNYAEQNNLSTNNQQNIEIIRKWTDDSVQEFIEDISSMQIKFHCDFPLCLFCTLEERVNKVMEQAKKDMEDTKHLSYYKVLKNEERFNYRTKI